MEIMDTTEMMSIILLVGVALIITYVIYSVKKEYEKMQTNSSQSTNEERELRDVEIILQDGTLYERYEGVLLTHFSPRVYQLHTLNDGEKELLVKIHLGEHMMLKAVVAAKEN